MSAGAPSYARPRHFSDHAEAKLTDRYSFVLGYFNWLETSKTVALTLVSSAKTGSEERRLRQRAHNSQLAIDLVGNSPIFLRGAGERTNSTAERRRLNQPR